MSPWLPAGPAISAAIALVLFGCAPQGSAPPGASSTQAIDPGVPTVVVAGAGSDRAPPPDPALVDRLRADVRRVAIRREPGSQGWRDVRALLVERLKEAGFDVELDQFGPGMNVIGKKLGLKRREELVILSAHYDHVWDCLGADDNASGVAAVLEAARALGKDAPDRTLMLAFWDYEEDGLLGSASWAKRARARGDDIELMISLDGIGYVDARPGAQTLPPGIETLLPRVGRQLMLNGYRGDFIALVADARSEQHALVFQESAKARGVPAVVVELSVLTKMLLLDAARSDHASFWLTGYPGMLVTDTANFRNPRYHCYGGPDDPSSLDYEFLARVTATVIDTTKAALAM